MAHEYKDCPLHNCSLGELERIAAMIPVSTPEITFETKDEVVLILHDYSEANERINNKLNEGVEYRDFDATE